MSRIESVIMHRREIPLVRPFVTAVRTAYTVDALLVEVQDSDGRSGWGEAPTSWRVTGESHASVTAAIEGPLYEAIRGMPVEDPVAVSAALERAVVRNSSARMAVDCAVYDLAARQADLPLYRYLGGERDVVRTDMTVSAAATGREVDELVRSAVRHVDDGFTTVKVKVGAGTDDRTVVAAVRAAVGPEVALRVDANQAWQPEQAVRIISAWEDDGIGVEFVEQPVHRDDVAGLAHVTEVVSTPILADETVWARRDLREVLRVRAADLINVKLAKTGGLREAIELAVLARQNEVGVVIGCMSETHVGIAAAAALASAVAPDEPQDLDAGLWLVSSPAQGGVLYQAELLRLSGEPGTGILGLRR